MVGPPVLALEAMSNSAKSKPNNFPTNNNTNKWTIKIKPAKTQKNIVLSQNQILVDPDTGQEIARGLSKADTGFYKLDPGEKLFNAQGEQIAFYEDPNQQVIKLNPGQTAFDQNGNVLFKADSLNGSLKYNANPEASSTTNESKLGAKVSPWSATILKSSKKWLPIGTKCLNLGKISF